MPFKKTDARETQAAQIQAAAALTASLLEHVAPKWEAGRITVEGVSSFAIELYADILKGIIEQTNMAYGDGG